jgi:hypothetical protein
MKYMLLCYDDEAALSKLTQGEFQGLMDEAIRLAHDMHAKGQYVTASPLHPTATATSVRVRDGKPMVTDGPFAETREQLGGYYIIDADNLDDAIALAARHPGARFGAVEIRPILEIAGLPDAQ